MLNEWLPTTTLFRIMTKANFPATHEKQLTVAIMTKVNFPATHEKQLTVAIMTKANFPATHEKQLTVAIGNDSIYSSTHVKLPGITIDNKLNFQQHISKLCKRTNRKIHALCRISQYIEMNKLQIIMSAFNEKEFNYCPHTWKFHNRTLNKKISKLHGRALRITYKSHALQHDNLVS